VTAHAQPAGAVRRRSVPRRVLGSTSRNVSRLFLVITLFCLIFPIYWLVQSSLSTNLALYHVPVYFFPPHPTLSGLRNAWTIIGPDLWHSAIIAVGTVILTLFLAITAGYGLLLSRTTRTATLVRLLVLFGLVFPTITFVIPLDKLLYTLHLLNTYQGLILADSLYAVPLGVLIIYTYMLSIPHELLEAARVDGASPAKVLWSVVIPVARPAVATAAIFAFLAAWGDFLFAETFANSPSVLPAAIGIYNLIGTTTTVVSWPEVMAGSLILGVPALLAIAFAQRYVVAGISTGALKG
jgi:multiple sugar transport system permease protein